MAAGRRRKAEAVLVQALAFGASPEDAAQATGISVRTVYRRLAELTFRTRVDALRADVLRREVDMLTAAGLAAIKTLVTLQGAATSEAVRLSAARSILEQGCRLRDNVALQGQLAGLEAQLATLLRSADRSPEAEGPR
jgi:hypothetical protein